MASNQSNVPGTRIGDRKENYSQRAMVNVLVEYVRLEESRGGQLMARFYLEAGLRSFAGSRTPPQRLSSPKANVNFVRDLLMPWSLGKGALVTDNPPVESEIPVGTPLFTSIVRYDTAVYLAMQWAFNPGNVKGKMFDSIEPLLKNDRLVTNLDDIMPRLQANDALRFLKGNIANKIHGRIDVYGVLTSMYNKIVNIMRPLGGQELLAIVFQSLYPPRIPNATKEMWWNHLVRMAAWVLYPWKGKNLDLARKDNPVHERIKNYIEKVRKVVFDSVTRNKFPVSDVLNANLPNMVYEAKIPDVQEGTTQSKRIRKYYEEMLGDDADLWNAEEISVMAMDAVIDMVPRNADKMSSRFFDEDVAKELFVCGCLFSYLRLVEAKFAMPYTAFIRTINIRYKPISRPVIEYSTIDKLEMTSIHWIHSYYQNGPNMRVGDSDPTSFVDFRYMIPSGGTTVNAIITELISKWKFIKESHVGIDEKINEKSEKFILMLEAITLRINSSFDDDSDIDALVKQTREIVLS